MVLVLPKKVRILSFTSDANAVMKTCRHAKLIAMKMRIAKDSLGLLNGMLANGQLPQSVLRVAVNTMKAVLGIFFWMKNIIKTIIRDVLSSLKVYPFQCVIFDRNNENTTYRHWPILIPYFCLKILVVLMRMDTALKQMA